MLRAPETGFLRESAGKNEVFSSKNPVSLVGCVTPELAITNYQLPITNYQLPITNYQLALKISIPTETPLIVLQQKLGFSKSNFILLQSLFCLAADAFN